MTTDEGPQRRIKLGVVADEFFEPKVGRMGGFGWAARQVARLFGGRAERGVDVIFLNRTLELGGASAGARIHGVPVLTRSGSRLADARRLRAERFDLLLFIDYRPSYRFFAAALPRTPVVVWVRDPRAPEDVRKVSTLAIPGAAGVRPQGIEPIDCTSLGKIVRASRLLGRRVLFATPAPGLAAKIRDTYDAAPAKVFFLPNPIDIEPRSFEKRARVVFLARLDPLKRPWLFAELAGHFPEVEFVFMGQPHFEGAGAWRPEGLPGNVRAPGHLDGAAKLELLASAAALVNTSIQEGLAVSFLESLACETPVISCQNPEGVASRFGAYVGRFDGDGRDSLPAFAEALGRLLRDAATRARLGREGRAWVAETHNTERFLAAFSELRAAAGLRR